MQKQRLDLGICFTAVTSSVPERETRVQFRPQVSMLLLYLCTAAREMLKVPPQDLQHQHQWIVRNTESWPQLTLSQNLLLTRPLRCKYTCGLRSSGQRTLFQLRLKCKEGFLPADGMAMRMLFPVVL